MGIHGTVRPTWLLAHDFSSASRAAAREAASDIARIDGALVLLHVCSMALPTSFDWISADATSRWQRDSEEGVVRDASARLWDECATLRRGRPSLPVEVLVREGSPAETILQVSRELLVDRIVVGTHGRTGLQHFLIGSIAERVARYADVPVLIVKSTPVEAFDIPSAASHAHV